MLSRNVIGQLSRGVATTPKEIFVKRPEAEAFIKRCMTAVKTNPKHAEQLAQCLVAADYRGHYSHGFNRLEMYVKDVKSGICKGDGSPKVLRETRATAHVDGNNLLGPVVGNFCMAAAMKKAKDEGIGFVVAKGSNHYGIAGWYSLQALEKGLLGLSFTNTSPLVVPTRARMPTLGTNPLTLAAPGKKGDSFVLDMATSSVALGKIEVAEVKKVPIPRGWGADNTGRETTDPSKVTRDGGLLPLGGSEAQGGYKGYGLSMMVEIFCGILSGGAYGNHIRRWKTTDKVANLGQCFIAINPAMFEPGFADRMQDLMDVCRHLEPAEGETEVLVAGDPERKHMALCDTAGGIPYHENFINNLNVMASQLKVEKVKINE